PVIGGLGLVAAVGLAVRHAIAEVLDDARALADAPPREHSLAVHWRGAHLEHVGTRCNARYAPLAPGPRARAAAGAARRARSLRHPPGAALGGALGGGPAVALAAGLPAGAA